MENPKGYHLLFIPLSDPSVQVDSSPSKTRFPLFLGLRYEFWIEKISRHWSSTSDTFYNQLTLQFKRSTRLKAWGLRATCPLIFSVNFWDKIDGDFRLTVSLNLWFDLRLRGYIPYGMRLFESHYPYGFLMQDIKTSRVFLKTFEGRTRGRLGTTREDFKTTQDLLEYIPASSWFKYFWELRACRTRGWLGTTHRGHQDYLKPSHSTTKYSRACCTDIPGPPWRQVQPDY
jgi:hypothetical protein